MTLVTFAVSDTFYQSGNFGFWVTGGQILEADILIDGPSHRPAAPGEKPEFDLKGTLVHEIGHFIGLEHTPLNNVALTEIEGTTQLVESPAVALRNAAGVLTMVGATPTMFPIYFLVDDGQGGTAPGTSDLAPDDIAGVSFLYPRGSQDMFFTISQEARTLTRAGFPSQPLVGGHVVAWADTDNDSLTPRVPLFSTMSGLYEREPLLGGLFNLFGMYKTLETFSLESSFEVSYVMTISPLNQLSFRRQAPPIYNVSAYDSILGSVSTFNTVFPSQVFHELGDILDIANVEVGTPLTFDLARNAVVSADSAKTLPTMLPGDRPMFGDANQICPLNLVTSASLTSNFPTALRGLRDNVLLRTAAGTAVVNAYYHVSPAVAQLLLRHTGTLRAFAVVAGAVEWAFTHYALLFAAALGAVAAGLAFLRRRRAAVAVLILLAISFFGLPAGASIRYLSETDMVALSDDIVSGTVKSTSSHWGEAGRIKGVIVTDVAVTVNDTAKGRLNKSATIFFKVLGGRVGDIATASSEIPTFKEGEEVFLYLQYDEDRGYTVVGGNRGKYKVVTDAGTGKKFVEAPSIEAQAGLASVGQASGPTQSKAKAEDTSKSGGIPLDALKQYIRDVMRQQEKR